MRKLNWSAIETISSGQWVGSCPRPAGEVIGIVDDSRAVKPGFLFVAIRGERVDGHDLLASAVANGAGAVCVERKLSPEMSRMLQTAGVPCLCVEETLAAFHRLARAQRRQFPNLRMVAVTGSSGKTSCRAMIESILECAWPGAVLGTEGNTNNHFGVPRNLLRLDQHHVAAVLELGSNHPGEIANLASLVEPQAGVITMIGRAHLEKLGGLPGVAREKGALLQALPASGTAVIPFDTPERSLLLELAGARRTISFGTDKAADVRVEYQGRLAEGLFRIRLSSVLFNQPDALLVAWPVGGLHQAENAAAAAAVAAILGVASADIVKGLQQCKLPGMRMEIQTSGRVHWVNDAYNANPDSVRASLRWFAELTEGIPSCRLFVVLGDMLELGADAAAEHLAVVRFALDHFSHSSLLCVGALMKHAAAQLEVASADTASDAKTYLSGNLPPDSWVLLKASRAVGLEHVIPEITPTEKTRSR